MSSIDAVDCVSRAQAQEPAAPAARVTERAEPAEPPPPPGNPVPEPATLLLVGTGLVGLALTSRRWRRAPASASERDAL